MTIGELREQLAKYPADQRAAQADAVTLAAFAEETHSLISRTLRGES